MRRDGSRFLWHQLCQRCKYTTSVDIQKTRYKKLFVHVESHASAVSLLESGKQRYIKAINNNNNKHTDNLKTCKQQTPADPNIWQWHDDAVSHPPCIKQMGVKHQVTYLHAQNLKTQDNSRTCKQQTPTELHLYFVNSRHQQNQTPDNSMMTQ